MQKNATKDTNAQSTRGKIKYDIPERVPRTQKYNIKYQSTFHTRKNIIQKTERVTHAEKYNTKYQSTFHTQKNKTQTTSARSTHRKIKHKTPARVPHKEGCDTKYQSLFHTRENITQSTRAHSTQGMI